MGRRMFVRAAGGINVQLPGTVYAGADPLGTHAYAVPSGSVAYVSTTGNDTNPGTLSQPYQTISKAVSMAPSGASTIVIRGGSYHESFTSPSSKQLTLIPYSSNGVTSEEVWFDGTSVYGSWTNNGNGTWTTAYSVAFDRTLNGDISRYPGGSTRHLVDQVWLDGTALVQIADKSTPGSGQFSVDQDAATLTVGTNPSGKTVRVTDLSTAIIVTGVIKCYGIGFRRYSPEMIEYLNSYIYFGGSSDGSVIEQCWFRESAIAHIHMTKTNLTISRCTFEDSGGSGVMATVVDGLVFERNLIRRYNLESWQAEPVTAGIKITRADNITLRQNIVSGGGDTYGIWLDVSCTRYTIASNVITGTGKRGGIEAELSDGGNYSGTQYRSYIVGNQVNGVGRTGILLFDTGFTVISNNDVRGNQIGVYIWQDNRQNSGSNPANKSASVVPWHAKNNTIARNMFGPGAATPLQLQLIAYDDGGTLNMVGGDMFDRAYDNWFAPIPPGSMVQLGAVGGARSSYNTPSAFESAPNSVGGPFAPTRVFGNSQSSSAPVTTGFEPIANEIAQLLGLPAGAKHLGPNPAALPTEA